MLRLLLSAVLAFGAPLAASAQVVRAGGLSVPAFSPLPSPAWGAAVAGGLSLDLSGLSVSQRGLLDELRRSPLDREETLLRFAPLAEQLQALYDSPEAFANATPQERAQALALAADEARRVTGERVETYLNEAWAGWDKNRDKKAVVDQMAGMREAFAAYLPRHAAKTLERSHDRAHQLWAESAEGAAAAAARRTADALVAKPAVSGPAAVADPARHIAALRDLLQIEHREQVKQFQAEIRRSLEERERRGTSVSGLELEQTVENGRVAVAVLTKNVPHDQRPFQAFQEGDLVNLTGPSGETISGTVYGVRGNKLGVSVEPGTRVESGEVRVDIGFSDVTHQRMVAALEALEKPENAAARALKEKVWGRAKAREGKPPTLAFNNRGLDKWQREAVRNALAAEDVYVIHGPPGTGKTTTLVELIWQAVRRGERVLATAPSNVAVDNIVEKLAKLGVKVVRMGDPARIGEHVRDHALDTIISRDTAVRALEPLRERLIQGLLEPAEEARAKKEIRGAEEAARQRALDRADVVLSTHGGIRGRVGKKPFDMTVLDEASQAQEPLSWIPLLQSKKAVFAGDPRQLPPTLHSMEAKDGGLGYTLMERLMALLPDSLQTMLRKQYRMHRDIMTFSSEEFYDGLLVADDSVKGHRAVDLPGVKADALTENPVVFIDTKGLGWRESREAGGSSLFNVKEAEMTLRVVRRLEALGLKPDQIGVISGYAAQLRRLRQEAGESEVEMSTVDGFQGREVESLVISLVRSNDDGNVGFLKDPERLNVALTRARRALILIGDSSTLKEDPLYAKLLKYIAARGTTLAAAKL